MVQRERRPVALVIVTPQFARLIQYAGLATVFKVFSQAADALGRGERALAAIVRSAVTAATMAMTARAR